MIKIEKITLECGSCGATKTRTDVPAANTKAELIANIFDAFDRDSYENRYWIYDNDVEIDVFCAQCADAFIGKGEW